MSTSPTKPSNNKKTTLKILRSGLNAAVTGVSKLTAAGLKSLNIAGNVADKAVHVIDKSVYVGATLIEKGVNVVGNVGESALDATGKIGVSASNATSRIGTSALKTTANVTTSALETTSVVSQQTAKVTQAVAVALGNISEATLQTSASNVKTGIQPTSKG